MKSSALAFLDLAAMPQQSRLTSGKGESSIHLSKHSFLSELGGSEHLGEVTALFTMLMQEGLPAPLPSFPASDVNTRICGSVTSRVPERFANNANFLQTKRAKLRPRSQQQRHSSLESKIDEQEVILCRELGKIKHASAAVSILGMDMVLLGCETQPTETVIDDNSTTSCQTFDSIKYNKRRRSPEGSAWPLLRH